MTKATSQEPCGWTFRSLVQVGALAEDNHNSQKESFPKDVSLGKQISMYFKTMLSVDSLGLKLRFAGATMTDLKKKTNKHVP